MKTASNFLVYLQALGGKFLGPNAYLPGQIKVRLNNTNLPYYNADKKPDDGEISPAFINGRSSFMPILTNHPTSAVVPVTVNYLTPDPDTTVVATGQVHLPAETTTMELVAEIPIPTDQQTLVIRQPVLFNKDLQNYKVTIVVPGLLVHKPTVSGKTVSAKVTMMCGCKVSNGSTPPYWLPSDFNVSAHLQFTNYPPEILTLNISKTGSDSEFAGTIQSPGTLKSIAISAYQISTGNYGFNQQGF